MNINKDSVIAMNIAIPPTKGIFPVCCFLAVGLSTIPIELAIRRSKKISAQQITIGTTASNDLLINCSINPVIKKCPLFGSMIKASVCPSVSVTVQPYSKQIALLTRSR